MPKKNKVKTKAKPKSKPKTKVWLSVNRLSKKQLKGRRVLVRVDFNVPIASGRVQNDFRITQSLPTIEYLSANGAKVILISHLGDAEASLRPVAERLGRYIKAGFYPGHEAREVIGEMAEGGVILLENLRRNDGEEKNGKAFSRQLADMADIFVNDAFSVCHRSHASVVGVAKLLPSYMGLLLESEVTNLSKAFTPAKPFVFVLGGAKFSTKIPLVSKFAKIADTVLVSGALANDLYRARGLEVGRSLVDKSTKGLAVLLKDKKIITPEEVIVSGFAIATKNVAEVTKQEVIVDASPEWLVEQKDLLNQASLILWNGPLGNFENGYDAGTKTIAKLIAESSAFSIIGGGDTIAAVEELHLLDKFSFVSTGGGAMLDFLAKGTLPGIEALKR